PRIKRLEYAVLVAEGQGAGHPDRQAARGAAEISGTGNLQQLRPDHLGVFDDRVDPPDLERLAVFAEPMARDRVELGLAGRAGRRAEHQHLFAGREHRLNPTAADLLDVWGEVLIGRDGELAAEISQRADFGKAMIT